MRHVMRLLAVTVATSVFATAGCASLDADGRPSAEEIQSIEQNELGALKVQLSSLAKGKVTRFASAAELTAARAIAYREYKLDKQRGKQLTASLGDLGDLLRPDQVIMLANLGRVYVGDTAVLSPESLVQVAQERLAVLSAPESTAAAPSRTSEAGITETRHALSGYSWQAEDRQYPYKMIGKSYHNTSVLHGEVGASTEFQKYREKYWWLGKRWYGLAADRLWVKTIVFKNDVAIDVEQDSDSNDSIVSVTGNWCVGKFPENCGSILSPYGLFSLHAVDHGAYKFRAFTANNVRDGANFNGYSTAFTIPW